MTDYLALFPLPIVVFPSEKLNLHIFEPRYRQLIHDCKESGITFGITPYLEGSLQILGTEVELLQISHTYPDGQMDIKCQGLGTFFNVKYLQNYKDRLYSGAEINRLITDLVGNEKLNHRIVKLMERLYQNMGIHREIPDPMISGFSFRVGHHIGLNKQQEFELLSGVTEQIRQEYIIRHLENFIPKAEEIATLRERIQMNGHFKNIDPPVV